jgi:hypothetical protein
MEQQGNPEPAGFIIDGREYPIPSIDSFDMDEAQLLWDYAGLTLADFAVPDPEDPDAEEQMAERSRKLGNPGWMRTLLHIAYQRGNPDVKPQVVKRLIGDVKLLDAMAKMVEESDRREDDAGPPDLSERTSEPDASSPSDSSESDDSEKPKTGISGNGSTNASDEPGEIPEPTGITSSATSFPASDTTESDV